MHLRLFSKGRKDKMSKTGSTKSLNEGNVVANIAQEAEAKNLAPEAEAKNQVSEGETSNQDHDANNDSSVSEDVDVIKEGDQEMEDDSQQTQGDESGSSLFPDISKLIQNNPPVNMHGTKQWETKMPTHFIFGKKPLNLSSNKQAAEKKGEKRKATQPPETAQLGNGADPLEVLFLIEQLEKTAADLLSLTNTHVHTKTEIKKLTRKLKHISDRFVNSKEEIQELHEETQRKKKIKGLQVIPPTCVECKKKVISEEDAVKRLEEEINNVSSIDNEEEYIEKVKLLAKSNWTDKMFLKTKLKKGFSENSNQTMVIVVGKGGEKSNLIRIMRSKFPEIEDLISAEEEDTMQYSESSTRTSKGKTTKRKLYVIKPGSEGELISSLKTICNAEKEGTLDIAGTEGINWTALRKETEMVFRSSELTDVYLVVPHNYEKEAREQNAPMKVNELKASTLNIRPKEEGQQDNMEKIIRKLKNEVNVEETGVTIEAIRRNKNGETEIRAKEKKAGAFEVFMKKVSETIKEEALVKEEGTERKKKTLVIRNIDTSTTEAEILGKIRALLPGNQSQEVSVTSLRPNFRQESLVCMVAVTREAADIILQQRSVKIGWVQCPVDLLVTPAQCYKCLCHGHLGRDCRSKPEMGVIKCRKCMQDGHKARDCTNEAKCADCKGNHPAGTMACKVYRELVNREKRGRVGWERENGNYY